LNRFLSTQVFGAARHHLLDQGLRTMAAAEGRVREARLRSLRTAISQTEAKRKRLVRNLELIDDPDPELLGDVSRRRAELHVEQNDLSRQLAELEDAAQQAPNPDLLARLPVTPLDLALIPDQMSRRLFEALRLEIHYDGTTNEALCRITLTGDTIDAVARTTSETAVTPPSRDAAGHTSSNRREKNDMTSHGDLATICVVPPTGFEPVLPP
jgi:site-specific DNA recombinase